MSYEALAPYYDVLINDEEGQRLYLEFVKKFSTPTTTLELACGSGMLANFLAKEGYQVDASDLSEQMIATAKSSGYEDSIRFFVMDMREFTMVKSYDLILCFCDSINYILEETEILRMFQSVYQTLRYDGVFLFDAHSMDRLVEFASGYEEANYLGDLEYQWTIVSKEDKIDQTLMVWDDSYVPPLYFEEEHKQRVYSPDALISLLRQAGFQEIEVYTDFDQLGIVEGEKQFFIARRKEQ